MGLGVAAVVDGRVVVPAAALEAVARVLGRVQLQGVGAVHSRGLVDAEAVAVGGEAEDELVSGHAGVEPGLDAQLARALVVAGVAGRGERGVGAGGRGPGAVDVVVHDHEIVEGVGETAQVSGAVAGGIVPGEKRSGDREGEVWCRRAQLLKECEEVGGVIVVDGIAAETLLVGVFPIEVQAVQLVLADEVQAGLDECRPVLRGTDI